MQEKAEKQTQPNIRRKALAGPENQNNGSVANSPDPSFQRNLAVIQTRTARVIRVQHSASGPETVVQKKVNKTGMPDDLKARMEDSLGADFSAVRIYPSSSRAPRVGALAYAQGNEVHFAPGQYNPQSAAGQSLLGHELTHVVQQRQGRVKPTTAVGGMPVNDSPALEKEADDLGRQA